MSSGLYGSNDSRLSSKAGAMEFSIVMNTTQDERGRTKVDYEEAKKLFDFICSNVTLPDVERDSAESMSECYTKIMEMLMNQTTKKE